MTSTSRGYSSPKLSDKTSLFTPTSYMRAAETKRRRRTPHGIQGRQTAELQCFWSRIGVQHIRVQEIV